jgi:hypothetical protein
MRKSFSILILIMTLAIVGCDKSTSPSGTGDCATTGTELTFYGSGGAAGRPFQNLQVVCFIASPTELKFSGKTLGPGVSTTAPAAYSSAYIFNDTAVQYKVFFKVDTLKLINVTAYPNTSTYYGQFDIAVN